MSRTSRAACAAARAIYRALLRIHPSARSGYASQMTATFDALLEAAARRGLASVAAVVVSESIGLLRNTQSPIRRPRLARLDVLVQDLRFVYRSLAAAPVFSMLVIATLALGMGANGALFVVIDRLFFRPPAGVHEVETLTRLYRRVPSRSLGASPADITVTPYISYPAFRDVEAALQAHAHVIAYGARRVPIGRGESPDITRVAWIGAAYFSALGVAPPALGRYLTDEECRVETPVAHAVISYEAWQRRFGASASVIGTDIELNRRSYTIVGVAAHGFAGTDTDVVDYWLPLGAMSSSPAWHQARNNQSIRTIVRRRSLSAEQVASAATAAYRAGAPPREAATTLVAGPLLEARGPAVPGTEVTISTRLAGVSLAVLVIACANVANLLIARGTRRRQEIGVRLALGISRGRLIGLFLLESLVLSLAAAAAAIVVSQWGAAAIRHTLMPDVTWSATFLDYRLAAFALAVATLSAVATGLPVALRSGRSDLMPSLRSGGRDGARPRLPAGSALLATQIALSIVLLIGAGAFFRSLQTAEAIRTGYETDRMILLKIRYDDGRPRTDETARLLLQVQGALQGRPGIDAVALSGWQPLGGYAMNSLFRADRSEIPNGGELHPSFLYVSPEFFRTSGIQLERGRGFTADDRAGAPPVMAVNRSMAELLWPGTEPIGRCLRVGTAKTDCIAVVGIVEDTNRDGLIEEVGGRAPMYFMPLAQGRGEFGSAAVAIVRSADPESTPQLADALQRDVRALLPTGVYAGVTPMRDTFAPQLRPWMLGATLFGVFGLLAVLVASVGTYSSTSYAVSHRTREMAIRTALGAARPKLIRLVVLQGLRPVAIGIAAGVVLALLSGRLISSLLYQTSPADPRVLAAACVTMAIVAAAGCVMPAWRAARIDPIAALKVE